jgi:Bacterial protein of unknown function (DUF885)
MASPTPDSRLHALWDLHLPALREEVGRHEYDGRIQDLSPEGVSTALGRLGGPAVEDPHDEAHLAAFEDAARVRFGELAMHRRNPLVHLENLDLACYDRPYAPEADRERARRAHLALWPEAVDMACRSLDAVPAPVATALLPAVTGLADGLPSDDAGTPAARDAHARLVDHLQRLARDGSPETAIGAPALSRLMGADDAASVDLQALAGRAEQERTRLHEMLSEGCARLAGDRPVAEVVTELLADHPSADEVVRAAAASTDDVIAFCRERGWLAHLDGQCRVGLAPPSRRWATAMLAWAGPEEPDAPSHYDITPPEPTWPVDEQAEWLSMFSSTALAAITAHEVAPGHFAHGRALRRVQSPVRRTLIGSGFAEGWAHYGEELMLEEGFHADDARFQIGVALEALVRVTRLACAIGLHTGALDVDAATRKFMADALVPEATARSEARRGTFDPTYGIYTWGKWLILDVREQARKEWGSDFSLRRFHDALLALGSPPLGLMSTAVARG